MKDKRVKIRRFRQIYKCTYCGQKGHNTRTCKFRQEKYGTDSQRSANVHESEDVSQ